MFAPRPPRLRRLSKRRAIAYVLSAAIFAGMVFLALRLSFPPDPLTGRGYGAGETASPVEVQTDRDKLTIRRDGESRTYRFRQTKDGVVAEQVGEEDQ